MKKRIFITAISVCLICAMGITSFAAVPASEEIRPEDGVMAFYGDATPGTYVSVTLLNPGYTEADMVTNPAAIQYFGGMVAVPESSCAVCNKTRNWCFHVQFTGSGEFTRIIDINGTKYSEKMTYYPMPIKQSTVANINLATTIGAELVDEAIRNFSIESGLESGVNRAAIGEALGYLRPASGFPYATGDDLKNFTTDLKKACLIAAYNTDNYSVLAPAGSLLYLSDTTLMSLAGTNELSDYENVSDKSLITADIFKNHYTNIGDIEKAFKKSIYFHILVDYKERGYGHVPTYFEKYETEYKDAGFKLDEFRSFAAKDDAYVEVSSSNAADLDKLKEDFNRFITTTVVKNNTTSSGISSGGGGGSAPNNSAKEDEPEVEPEQTTPAEPTVETVEGFTDVPVTHWAAEAVKTLAKDDIMVGKGDGNFDLNGRTTRAEIIKIAVMGLLGDVNKDAKNPFGDSAGHWAEVFIATAVESGITTGITPESFDPNGIMTREQAATILYRAAIACGYEFEVGTDKFADDSGISDWARDPVYALTKAGVVNGRDGNNFCAGDPLTRGEAAKLLYELINLKKAN